MSRTQWISKSRGLHRFIGWLAALTLFLFVCSGLMHILMVWTGPQSAKFFPPQATISADELAVVPTILSATEFSDVQLIQVVPTEQGNALQVTESSSSRRYFSLQNGEEWPDYDPQQAHWLARYFTGLEQAPIKSVTVQGNFDNQYPWVNRLLPVYRITFDTPDQRTAYIYTEFAALAGLTNNWKNNVQGLFQTFHTWQWLENISEPLRMTIMLILLGGLGLMIISGLGMRLTMPGRRIPQTGRRWHRRLSLWMLLPVLAFLISGIWHLLTYSGNERQQGLQLPDMISLPKMGEVAKPEWLEDYKDQPVQGITLLQGPFNQLLYRVALPEGKMDQHVGHHQRFDGQSTEQPARYYDVVSGQPVSIEDTDIARYWAKRHSGLNDQDIENIQRVSHFSPEYDFRNKRLPVWRVDFNNISKTSLFIDAASGLLVDRSNASQRLEGNVFATLHKWAQLGHLWGQGPRDALMVFVVLLILGFAVMGIRMLLRR